MLSIRMLLSKPLIPSGEKAMRKCPVCWIVSSQLIVSLAPGFKVVRLAESAEGGKLPQGAVFSPELLLRGIRLAPGLIRVCAKAVLLHKTMARRIKVITSVDNNGPLPRISGILLAA